MSYSTKTGRDVFVAQLDSVGASPRTEGTKYDVGKPRLSLISPEMWPSILPIDTPYTVVDAVDYIARAAHNINIDGVRQCVTLAIDKIRSHIGPEHTIRFCCMGLEYGLVKYERNNWKSGFTWSRLLDAALRHIVLGVAMDEDIDKESGNPHWGHALCMLMFLLHSIREYPELNDIY